MMYQPHELGLLKVAYTLDEARHLLSIGRTSFYDLIRCGHLKTTKLGKKTLVLAVDLAVLVLRLREDPTLFRDRTKTTAEAVERLVKARQIPEEGKARRRQEAEEILAAVGK